MQYRTIPKTGDKISAIGYGCMRFPTRAGRIDEKKAEAQIRYAIEQGVNYFDTALPYHNGESEKFLGKVLEGELRSKVKLATKLPPWRVKTREDMDKILQDQLKSLRTNQIDYYLIHGIQSPDVWERMLELGVIDFLNKAKENGLIKSAGFSYHSDHNYFSKVIDDYDWDFCQIQYSYLDENNQAGKKGLEYAASKDIAVFVMEPLRGGSLVGKLPKRVESAFEKSGQNRSAADWALSWILNHKEVTCVLSGMNVDEHIKENIEIANKAEAGKMSSSETAVIEEVKTIFDDLMKVPCTGCAYCMPCPVGVDIPSCFEHYNNKSYFGLMSAKPMYMMATAPLMDDKSSKASLCIDCGKCEPHCPQHIEIRKELKKVAKEMEAFYDPALIWVAKKIM